MNDHDDVTALEELHKACRTIREQLSRVIVGQEQVIEEMLIALLSGGHCLLVGVPGLAKTLMIRTLARSLALQFRRIQFTPDLMPTDITGTEVIQEDKSTGERTLRFLPGPIFANIVLADEINRTPPKTQAALLEAMEEQQVTFGGTAHKLPRPFFVLATQNPIEHEGTYPLPEAQLDRFMLNILVDYPNEEEELQIVERTTGDALPQVTPTIDGKRIEELVRVVRRVPVATHVAQYAVSLARATRTDGAPDFIRQYVQWGAGPRASQFMILSAKSRAAIHGRKHATCDDVRAVAAPVLRHRIRLNFNADAEGVTVDSLVQQLLSHITSPSDEDHGGSVANVFRSTQGR